MKRVATLLLAALTFIACNDAGISPAESGKVAPGLVGEWYYLDTMRLPFPSPSIAFSGIQIVQGDTIMPLGIETATGRVALKPEEFPRILLQANGGILVWQVFAPPDLRIDTLRYAVEPDRLTLTDRYRSTTYYRTRIGVALMNPVQSAFEVEIDGRAERNPNVAAYPSAYVAKPSALNFQLHVLLDNGSVFIEVDNFHGVGEYSIQAEKGRYAEWYGDVVSTFLSREGTIIVERYDEGNNQCSGRFHMTVTHPTLRVVHELRNGLFTVPVYR